MAEAIVVRKYGGPEVLQLENIPTPQPRPNELLIKQNAVGINYHDIYCRSGQRNSLKLPGTPGIEGAGVVLQTGTEVHNFKVGDRVAYITSGYNGYASERTLPFYLAVPIPDQISDVTAASVILKGLTVNMLVNKVARIKPKDRVLVHAAAGGVGHLLVQTAKRLGATVIGTVGSEAKAEVATNLGCDHIILYRKENVLKRVMEITKDQGLHIVYDSVGKDTFHDSLNALDYEGHLVVYGQSSGPIDNFEVSMLAKKSLTLSRPMVFHYTRKRADLTEMSAALFQSILDGKLVPRPPMELPLANAMKAHELLESRKTAQPIVLIP